MKILYLTTIFSLLAGGYLFSQESPKATVELVSQNEENSGYNDAVNDIRNGKHKRDLQSKSADYIKGYNSGWRKAGGRGK